MARVEIYNGHSSIIPVLFATYDPQWKPCLDNMNIKEEPVDSDASDGNHVERNSSDDTTITGNSKTTHHVNTEVATPNTTITSKEDIAVAGSSSTCLNINKHHVDDSGRSNYDSKNKSTNATANPNHVGSDVNVINSRLRARTKSTLVECDICHITFSDVMVLKSHKNYYAKGEVTCHLCKTHFSTPIHLTSHRRSVHRGDDWNHFKFECHYCKLGFVKKHYLQQHIFHYHDINKILNSKKYRRMRKRNAAPEKVFPDSKLHDPPTSKRKRSDKATVGPPRKKFAMHQTDKKIDQSSEDQMSKVDQYCKDNEAKDTQPHQSISDAQTNNEVSETVDGQLNSLIQPPLVKICAIPHEVESLLNDSESSVDDSSSDSDASDAFSDSELSDSICYEPTKTYSLRSSSRLASTPNRSSQRKWAILKKRHNCQSCEVSMERLSPFLSHVNESTNNVSDVDDNKEDETIQINSMPTVGMELKNLEWALKKLQTVNQEDEILTEEDPTTAENDQESCESTNVALLPSQDIPTENPSITRILYISSLCQTRYTTKKKLVYHYLCYHTNPQYQECAVCRSSYDNITILRKHLMQHCIEIPESSEEKSPIDPKEPCENSKEKYMCRGCKKKFWLVSYLKDHEQQCEILSKSEEINSMNDQQVNDQIKSDELPQSILRTRLTRRNANIDSSSQTIEESIERDLMSLNCNLCHTKFKNTTQCVEHKKKYLSSTLKFPCHRCGTPFPSRSILGAHTRTAHESDTKFDHVCIICDQGFREKSSLRQHMMHIHNDEMKDDPLSISLRTVWTHERTCSVCKLTFPDRKCLIEHVMHYFDDNVSECSTCHESFSSQSKVLSHKKKVHHTEEIKREQIYCCALCDEGFIYPIDMYSHTYHIHNTAISADKYVSMSADKRESNRHGLLYACRICDAKFSTAELLKDHQVEYSNSGNFLCSFCPRRYETHPLLDKHMKLAHIIARRNTHIKCNFCDEVLASNASWQCHMKHIHPSLNLDNSLSKIHSDAAFSKESGIVKIVVSETENTSDPRTPHPIGIEYTCAVCDEQFMTSTDLKIHSHNYGNACIHSNTDIVNTNFSIASIYSVKPEEYEKLCNSEDNGINSIKIDQLNNISGIIDKVEKRAAPDDSMKESIDNALNKSDSNSTCGMCKIRFTSRNALLSHERLYSNAGEHECKQCHRKFRTLIQLQIHVRKHVSRQFETFIPQHYCETCDERFNSESSKIIHFAHIHHQLLPRTTTDRNESRHLTRLQSKTPQQTTLDSFIRSDTESEKSKKSPERFCTSGIDLSNEMLPFIKLGINQKTSPNSNPELELPQIIPNNIRINVPMMAENVQKNSNTLSEVARNTSKNKNAVKTPVREELEVEVIEVPQKVTEERQQSVVTEHDTEIVVEEEEIIEVNVPTTLNTSNALCDICGDVFKNRNELADHQKKTHDIDLNIDTLSDTQEEYIDIELISDDEVQYETSTNVGTTDLDIIFDSACVRASNKTYTSLRPLKPHKTFTKKHQLTCRICYSLFSSLNSLVKHLEEEHQTDSPKKIDSIQNPRVSSSSKPCNLEERINVCHMQLCCRFCGKRFVDDQYLIAHIKKSHTIDISITPPKKVGSLQNSNLSVKNFDETDDTQNNTKINKYTHPKLSRITIVKTTDVTKKNDDILILGDKQKRLIDISQNSININPTRCRRIPMTKLFKTVHKTPTLPKSKSLQNNDMSR